MLLNSANTEQRSVFFMSKNTIAWDPRGKDTYLSIILYFDALAEYYKVPEPSNLMDRESLCKRFYKDFLEPLGVAVEFAVHDEDKITEYEIQAFTNKHRNKSKAEKAKLVPPVLGDAKKVHAHVFIQVLGKDGKGMTPDALYKHIINQANGFHIIPRAERTKNPSNAHLYLTHRSSEARAYNKHVYERERVINLGGYTVASTVSLTKEFKNSAVDLLIREVLRLRISDWDEFYTYLNDHEGDYLGKIPTVTQYNSFGGNLTNKIDKAIKGVYSAKIKQEKIERQQFEDERAERYHQESLEMMSKLLNK